MPQIYGLARRPLDGRDWTLGRRPSSARRRPQLSLRQLSLQLKLNFRRDLLDGVWISDEIVLAHVERQDWAVPESGDPPIITPVQRGPVVRGGILLHRSPSGRDSLAYHVERS